MDWLKANKIVVDEGKRNYIKGMLPMTKTEVLEVNKSNVELYIKELIKLGEYGESIEYNKEIKNEVIIAMQSINKALDTELNKRIMQVSKE